MTGENAENGTAKTIKSLGDHAWVLLQHKMTGVTQAILQPYQPYNIIPIGIRGYTLLRAKLLAALPLRRRGRGRGDNLAGR